MKTPWNYNDGGRAAAGYKGHAGDCTVRAIAIATGQDYQTVYNALFEMNRACNKGRKASPRDGGTKRTTIREYMQSIGWTWIPCMTIGSGCRVHYRADELPSGAVIVSLSKHMSAMIDGVIHDTYDPSRNGTRCVYGYYKQETK